MCGTIFSSSAIDCFKCDGCSNKLNACNSDSEQDHKEKSPIADSAKSNEGEAHRGVWNKVIGCSD